MEDEKKLTSEENTIDEKELTNIENIVEEKELPEFEYDRKNKKQSNLVKLVIKDLTIRNNIKEIKDQIQTYEKN